MGERATTSTPFGPTRRFNRAVTIATAVAFGFGIGAAADVGAISVVIASPIIAIVLVGLVRLVASRDDRPHVAMLAVFAFVLRFAAASGLYVGAVWQGRGGFITGDDRAYSQLAWAYAQWLHGAPDPALVPPDWGGSSHLLGTLVYLIVPVYYLAGPRPLLIAVMNAGLAAAATVIIWDIARRAFGRRPAALTMLLLAVAPANILFSALVLKDAAAFLITTLVLWSAFRFQRQPAWQWILMSAVSIVLMYSIRGYASYVLLAVLVLAVLLSPGLPGVARSAWLATSGIACGGALLVALTGGGGSVPAYTLSSLDQIRQGMARGANTAFVADSAVFDQRSDPGEEASSAFPAPPAETSAPPVTLDGTPLPTMARAMVALAVLFPLAWQASKLAARPLAATAVLVLTSCLFLIIVWSRMPQLELAGPREGSALARTLTYTPYGLANVVLAPYPWALRRMMDLPTVPDAILNYVALIAAVATLVSRADLRRMLTPTAAFIVGTLVILMLSEGNVGTAFRHRTMSVAPFVLMLAAPSLILYGDRVGRLWRRSLGRDRQRPSAKSDDHRAKPP